MPATRPVGEDVSQVSGGDLGLAGDLASVGQVGGQVTREPQAGLQCDVAERAAPGPAAALARQAGCR